MMSSKNGVLKSSLVVFSAGAFFFYSFIQMTLFSTEAMKLYFMELLSLQTPAEFGTFAGTFLWGTVLMLIPAGVLLDKIPVKRLVVSSIAVEVLLVVALSFTKDVFWAGVIRFIMGIIHCVAFMAPFRLAPRWFSSNKLALIAGLLVTFGVFGGWFSGSPMLAIIKEYGGQNAMFFNAAIGIIIFLLAELNIKNFPDNYREEESSSTGVSLLQGLKLAARNRQNWLAGLYIGLLNLSVLLLGAVWGTTYLNIVNPDLSEETYTGIIGMIFIGTMIGSPLSGWISDTLHSRKKVMVGGSLLSLVVMLVIMFPPVNHSVLFYILFLLLGIITASQSVGYPVVGESNEDKILGTANGLAAVLLMGMGAIGQPLFGQLVSVFGGGDGAGTAQLQEAFQTAIWVMPVAFVGALICALLVRETFKRK